jgi:hypothetical protein
MAAGDDPPMSLKIKCANCGEGDSPEKGKVFIYPAGNFHEGCPKKEKR